MKRKVAVGGRLGREFSWSMSVEPGERYSPKTRFRCDLQTQKIPEFVLADADANGKLRVFQGMQETRGTVL